MEWMAAIISVISISSKRQVTIPQKFFENLGFQNEAECIVKDGGIFIKPIGITGDDFSEEILKDLVTQGYSGNKLLEKFKECRKQIRPAVEKMMEEADLVAKEGAGISMDALFGAEEK